MTVVGTVTEVVPAVSALARTMEKIYEHRGIAIDVDGADAGAVPRRAAGSRGDGRQSRRQCLQVGAVARQRRGHPRTGDGKQKFRIIVDDDGPGLTAVQREQVARRGRRLDETKPGSGLGLSIVVELAMLYGGHLHPWQRADRGVARGAGVAGGVNRRTARS